MKYMVYYRDKYMVYYRDNLANISLKAVCQKAENNLESARKAELLIRNEEKTFSE